MIPDNMLWNEAEVPHGNAVRSGLVSLLVIKDNLSLELIGTAFLITAEGNRATAVTAAHCFEEIRKLLHPNSKHHTTALPEFLPGPKELNLKQVKALYEDDNQVFACTIEQAYWDPTTDLAVFTLLAPVESPDLFHTFCWIDDQIPLVGEQVAAVGYADMKVNHHDPNSKSGTMQRRLVIRLGRVEGVYPTGHYMLKTPCVEMTVPVFSGMSGGLVARFGANGTQMQPFGIVSHSPDPQPLYDRSQSGHSMCAILQATKTPLSEKKQEIQMPMTFWGYGKTDPQVD
jgi:trypsin-like peptidase